MIKGRKEDIMDQVTVTETGLSELEYSEGGES